MLDQEHKSVTDGTKPDAALGFFYLNGRDNQVKAVVELKDYNTDLDKKQKRRKTEESPVSQAFLYATKAGGSCKWVIVSNFKEIRFYNYQIGQAKYQSYSIIDLGDSQKFKEFLFLFHKDYLVTNQQLSKTEKLLDKCLNEESQTKEKTHILDEVYNCVQKFNGLGFVDPHFISSIRPFNILNEHVWHYERGVLFTLNPDIYSLLLNVSIENKKITISENLKEEVDDCKLKLEQVFTFLNNCHIHEIKAVSNYEEIEERRSKGSIGFSIRYVFNIEEEDGVSLDIDISPSSCDCMSCKFRSLDIKDLISTLKSRSGNQEYDTLEHAYGNYKVAAQDYKATYLLLKRIQEKSKDRPGKEIEYFLAKLNLQYLHNLVEFYDLADRQSILEDIRSIDLDYLIADEIDLHIDSDVRRFLIEIKENKLIDKVRGNVEKALEELKKQKQKLEEGTRYFSTPNHFQKIHHQYSLLFLFINRNFIVYDNFRDYKTIATKAFEGLITSYQIPDFGVTTIPEFYLTEAILHINSEDLKQILKPINLIEIEELEKQKLLLKVQSLLNSTFDIRFGKPRANGLFNEGLENIDFKMRIGRMIDNVFAILAKLKLTENEVVELFETLIPYLKVESVLPHWTLSTLSDFIKVNSDQVDRTFISQILSLSIENDKEGNLKYKNLIKGAASVLKEKHSDFRIENVALIKKAIGNCYSENGNADLVNLVYLYHLCSDKLKAQLLTEFDENLSSNFSSKLYEKLLWERVIDVDYQNYFMTYLTGVNKSRLKGFRGTKDGKPIFDDFFFYNLVMLLNFLDFDRNDERLIEIKSDLSAYESWLIDPENYNYKDFELEWIFAAPHALLRRIGDFQYVTSLIEIELSNTFNAKLAEIYFKVFREN